VPAIKPL